MDLASLGLDSLDYKLLEICLENPTKMQSFLEVLMKTAPSTAEKNALRAKIRRRLTNLKKKKILSITPAGRAYNYKVKPSLKNQVASYLSKQDLPNVKNRLTEKQYKESSLVPLVHEPNPEGSWKEQYQAFLNSYFSKPRESVTYKIERLRNYKPNKSFYLNETDRKKLKSIEIGMSHELSFAETYKNQVIKQYLLNFCFFSSKLEGVKKSFAETKRIIEAFEKYPNTNEEEIAIIINHRNSVKLLIDWLYDPEMDIAEELSQGSSIISQLHYSMMYGLIEDDNEGEIRQEPNIEISGSTYLPIAQLSSLRELLDEICMISQKIKDPYEQAFFLMLHISYLQAFDDGNKRTGRLVCSIPLILNKLAPHPFLNMEEEAYLQSIVYFYESGDADSLAKLWVESYIESFKDYQKLNFGYKELNQAKKDLKKLTFEVIKAIVVEQISEIEMVTFSKRYFKKHNKTKYQFETFLPILKTDLLKLTEDPGKARIFKLNKDSVEKWLLTWKPQNT